MFGDLTTLTLSYALGDDLVRKADDATFERDLDKQVYGIGLTQILTRNLITSANLEIMTDEGYLNNPYRSVRYLDATEGYKFEGELYPNTRTSTALGLRARYFLPYRAAIEGEYRYFTDTWDMEAHTTSLTYIQPWRDFTFTAKYRYHDQTAASFYRDIFAGPQATNFRARDKELSPLDSTTMSLKVAYTFLRRKGRLRIYQKGYRHGVVCRPERQLFRLQRFEKPATRRQRATVFSRCPNLAALFLVLVLDPKTGTFCFIAFAGT